MYGIPSVEDSCTIANINPPQQDVKTAIFPQTVSIDKKCLLHRDVPMRGGGGVATESQHFILLNVIYKEDLKVNCPIGLCI